ncbi:anti-sigma factor [Streptomyces sp. BH-SS-21]|uniref:Regulator of SigK n=1 Tax=Streptomyces liliiviolaceus TaxID=2823109 RepID=A0A940XU85_9ACTN|nr:anti-sigma factor [Streptomyces liliiviolaceus]MBQ0850276.1 anti-sigma factor [Streptomyces liliiviolaceus]
MSSNADIHSLTGAYALHALDEDERAVFDIHLRACRPCHDEVAGFTATAVKLAAATAVTAPSAMKHHVLSRLSTARQVTPLHLQPPANSALRRRLSRLALVACLIGACALGSGIVWQHHRADAAAAAARQTVHQSDQLAAVLAAYDAVSHRASLQNAAQATVVVSRSRDQAVLIAADVPPPPPGKVYQLWYGIGESMRPAGLMDTRKMAQAVMLAGSANTAFAVGVTVEPAGGSVHPTSAPLALLALTA